MWDDWMDFNRDGEVDSTERMFGEEMLCTSKREHRTLSCENYDFDDEDDGFDDEDDDSDWDDEF